MSETTNNGTATPTPALSERVRSLRLQETSEPAGNAWWWLPWGLCAVLFCATAFFALEAFSPISDELLKKMAEDRGLQMRKDGLPGTNVTLPGSAMIGTSANDIALESKGYIVPISLIQVSPIISGTVMKLNVEEGKEVKKNVILAEIDDTEFKADRDRTDATRKLAAAKVEELRKYRSQEVQQAKADLDEVLAQRDQWLGKYTRSKRLKETTSISPEDYETAKSSYLANEARIKRMQLAHELLIKGPRDEKIAAVEAEMLQAQADFDKADWRYNNTKVKAPIDGVILSKKTEQGNIVNPSAFSNGLSASLCEMADLYELEVDLAIAERDLSKVFKDQECRIRAEAFPQRIYTGKVTRIMPTADRSKGAVPVRAKIYFPAMDAKGQALPKEKQGEYLRPDMGAIVTFLNKKSA
jgi:HlyD family secretion protein